MTAKVYNIVEPNPSEDLVAKVAGQYSTILADPPWQFQNRTGKMAPEHKRLLRYPKFIGKINLAYRFSFSIFDFPIVDFHFSRPVRKELRAMENATRLSRGLLRWQLQQATN